MSRKIFGLIALTAAIAQIKAPTMFLWDTLIGIEKTERTQKFEVHTKSAGRIKAPLVSKREKGVLIEKQAFEVTMYEPPMLKIYTINYAEELFEQGFGQTQYDDYTSIAKQELAKQLKELKDIAARTKLYMLSTLTTTGVCPVEDGKQGIKYGDFNKEILSGTDAFNDPNCDIIAYLEKKQLEIQKKTGIVIDTLIVHPDVTDAIMKNKYVIEYLKMTNANLFQVNHRVEKTPSGEKLIAFLPKLNMTIYSYVDWVRNPDEDEEVDLLPSGTIIGVKKGSFSCHYGALAVRSEAGKRATVHVKKEVVITRYPDDSNDDLIELNSAPLIMPEDAQGWFCAEVLA